MSRNLSVTYKYHSVHATAAELQEELINQFSSPKMHVKVFNKLTFPLKPKCAFISCSCDKSSGNGQFLHVSCKTYNNHDLDCRSNK